MKVNVDKIRNHFEVGIYKQLLNLKVTTPIEELGYEADKIPYTIEAVYNPDFTIRLKDGHTIFLESKGYLRPEDKRKMVAAKRQNPEADIRIVFQKNHRFPRSKTTYSMWAEKNGFPWSVGTVPKEWFR